MGKGVNKHNWMRLKLNFALMLVVKTKLQKTTHATKKIVMRKEESPE
jgi:hypothetical protein